MDEVNCAIAALFGSIGARFLITLSAFAKMTLKHSLMVWW